MTSNNAAAQGVALGYEFEDIFTEARGMVAMLNRQRGHPGREQRLAVIWEDDIERRLLRGTWKRINNELLNHLSGWISEAHIDTVRADFKLTLHDKLCPCLRESLEGQFKRTVRAAFLSEILNAAELKAISCMRPQEHIHDLVSTLALCPQ